MAPKRGAEIDLKKSRMSVEQALRELKEMVEDDIQNLIDNRYYVKPARKRRERAKRRRAAIRSYNKYN